MKDRILIVVGAVVLCGVVVWVIRSESARFREEISESADESIREGMSEAAENVVEKAGEEAENVIDKGADRAGDLIDKAAGIPGEIIGDIKEVVLDSGTDKESSGDSPESSGDPNNKAADRANEPSDKAAGKSGTIVGGETGEVQDSSRKEESSVDSPESSGDQNDRETGPGIFDPIGILGEAVRVGQQAAKTVDQIGQEILALSPEEERRYGEAAHRLVRNNSRLNSSKSMQQRLNRLARPLLEHGTRDGIQYRFNVVEDPEVNAFAHLGGYVYVNTGLLKLVGDKDTHLQFVLGHEIAHVELKHVLDNVTYAARAGEVTGELGANIASLAYQAIALGYSEDKELDADAWSCRKLMILGRSRRDCIEFLEMMGAQGGAPEQDTQTPDKVAGAVASEIKNHFRSHPPTITRIENLEKIEP